MFILPLTGPFELAGTAYPNAVAVECVAERVQVVEPAQSRARLREERYKLTGSLSLGLLSHAQMRAVVADASQASYSVRVRTQGAGEASVPLQFEARTTSPLPLTSRTGTVGPVTGPTGVTVETVGGLTITWRSLQTFSARDIGIDTSSASG